MSAEAMRYVQEHFPHGGAALITMMSLAYLSKDRRDPFTVTAGYRELAEQCRCSKRRAHANCESLVQLGHLVAAPGSGRGGKTVFTLRVKYPHPEPQNVVTFSPGYGSKKGDENGNRKGVENDTIYL